MTLIRNIDLSYKASDSSVVKFDTRYQAFKRIVVSRTIDGVCGEFTISMSRPKNNAKTFKAGDVLDIVLDGQQVMRGKIYTVDLEGDAFEDLISISGRDITGDLIDSTVPDDSKTYTDGANIFQIAGKILQSKGMSKYIGIHNDTGGDIASFTKDEIVSCEIGDTVIEFLMKYCRKRQIFLNTSVRGDLVFFKAQGKTTGNQVINNFKNNNNNVISYKTKFGIADRYNKYICKSQGVQWVNGKSPVSSEGTVTDHGVSPFRELEFKLEEGSSGSEECKKRAAEESNVRRARAFEYEVVVQGFKGKQLWDVNQLVTVSDDRAGVQGEFLVRGVEYKVDSREGSTTKLTITNNDAYTAQAAVSLRDRQKSSKKWYNEVKSNVEASDALQFLMSEILGG